MKQSLQKRLAYVLSNQNNILFACLFGSKAKKKSRYGSDTDIAVYFDKNPSLLELGELVNNLQSVTESKVDLVKLNSLDKNNPRLAYSILCDCIILILKDERIFKEFKSSVILHYLDFKFISDMFDAAFKERLALNQFAVFDK
jgi:predicted nucleotidyltransferase